MRETKHTELDIKHFRKGNFFIWADLSDYNIPMSLQRVYPRSFVPPTEFIAVWKQL